MVVTSNAVMHNVSKRVYDEREPFQVLLSPTLKMILGNYQKLKKLPFNYVLGKILEDTVNNEKNTAEVRKLQPAYKMIKGSRTVIRIEVETAKRIRETAVQKKGETLSSFTNAAVYYFLKNGDFETLPELKQSIDEIENIEL
ncbi:hypothetical protein AAGT40_003236 [Acinetobacter baumannii]